MVRTKGLITTSTYVVELKHGLSKATEKMRLLQQVREYAREMKAVFVVICGDEVRQEFLHDLENEHGGSWSNLKVGAYWKHDDGALRVLFEP
jgi:exonuclease III